MQDFSLGYIHPLFDDLSLNYRKFGLQKITGNFLYPEIDNKKRGKTLSTVYSSIYFTQQLIKVLLVKIR